MQFYVILLLLQPEKIYLLSVFQFSPRMCYKKNKSIAWWLSRVKATDLCSMEQNNMFAQILRT